MKKKILCFVAVVLVIVTLVGCGSNKNPDYSISTKDNYMTKVEEGEDYTIYVDDQGVMYYQMFYGSGQASRMAMTAMINPDGTARMWEVEEK